MLFLAEEHINGVMSWWLISQILSREKWGRKFKPVTHKLTPNQLMKMDRNLERKYLNIVFIKWTFTKNVCT